MTTPQRGQIAGLFGAVALGSALFSWFLTENLRDGWVVAQLVLAIASIAFWAVTNRDKLPGQVGGHGAFYGVTSVLTVLVLAAGLAALNYIAVKKPDSWLFKSRDLTKDRIFTLSDQTTSVLRGLKETVRVVAFYGSGDPEFGELSTRLRQYREVSDKLAFEMLDPAKHPREVQESNISQSGPRVIVKAGKRESRAKDVSEEALTNALAEVTRGSSKKVYFTKGHGEHSIADNTERGMKAYADSLKSDGYQIDEIILAEHKTMPADVQALVVAGPVAGFTEGEARLVSEWTAKGGRLVAMIDPGIGSGLEAAFASWGINLGNDEVIDLESQVAAYATAMPAADHPITTPKTARFALASVLPLARSVQRSKNVPSGFTVVELLKTGARSWGEVDPIKEGQEVSFTPGRDLQGPVPVAVAASRGQGDAETRVVVVGNSNFAANAFFRFLGNRDFALNAVSWVAHEEARISIRPKARSANHLFLTADQVRTMKLFAFDVLPFSLLFAGLLVWQTRKNR
jgi:ABC-type uncharacterized transport system involved in gliding motility auxiliary subunit